jgi:hypothetical protein
MDEVMELTGIIKAAIVPIYADAAPEVYPSISYFDLYTDLAELLENGKGIESLYADFYATRNEAPVSKTRYAAIAVRLKERFDKIARDKGNTHLRNILSIISVDNLASLERTLALLYTATNTYFSTVTDRG